VPARAIDAGIGDRTGTKDQFVLGREGIHSRRILSHEEVGTQPLAPQGGFKKGIGEGLLLKRSCLETNSQNFVKSLSV
jgi:hypothetical protein